MKRTKKNKNGGKQMRKIIKKITKILEFLAIETGFIYLMLCYLLTYNY